MEHLTFTVRQAWDGWFVEEPEGRSITYATREAAFEALAGPVSNALKEGAAITITIDPPLEGEGTNETEEGEPLMIPS